MLEGVEVLRFEVLKLAKILVCVRKLILLCYEVSDLPAERKVFSIQCSSLKKGIYLMRCDEMKYLAF
jgi:hypothetical protein